MSGIKVANIEDGVDWRKGKIRKGPNGSHHYDEESVYHTSYTKVVVNRSPDEVWERKWSKTTSSSYYASSSNKLRRIEGFSYSESSHGFGDEPTEPPAQNSWIDAIEPEAELDYSGYITDEYDHSSTDGGYEPCDQKTVPVAETSERSKDDVMSEEVIKVSFTWVIPEGIGGEPAGPPTTPTCDYSTNGHEADPSPYDNGNVDDLCVEQHFADLVEHGVCEFGSTIEEVAEFLTKLGHPTGKTKAKSMKDRYCPHAFKYSREVSRCLLYWVYTPIHTSRPSSAEIITRRVRGYGCCTTRSVGQDLESNRVQKASSPIYYAEKGTPAGVVYNRAQGPALGSWGDRRPAAY
eukprot:6060588-Pyramimonas_sp.AAC.1